MYLVDEVYDGDGPRELELVEKFTVRVVAGREGADSDLLGAFVSKYSLCQHVEELQILWSSVSPAPAPSSFVYAHTHSRVLIIPAPDAASNLGSSIFASTISNGSGSIPTPVTEAILLLDLRAQVDCLDLAFAHSVWRSSRQTLVGFFPWLHRHTKTTEGWKVYDWWYVWWNQTYSLLHPAGLFVEKGLLSRLGEHAGFKELMSKSPECFEFALSVLSAKEKSTSAPIWVNVPASCPGCFATLPSIQRASSREQCLGALAAAFQVDRLPYSIHKSSKAKSFLFWSS